MMTSRNTTSLMKNRSVLMKQRISVTPVFVFVFVFSGESWQKTLLIHSVARDSLRRLTQPKLSK